MPNTKFDINVIDDPDGVFISDREGDVVGHFPRVNDWLKSAGITSDEAQTLARKHKDFFDGEFCFLFGKNGSNELGFWVEFELDDDYMPDGFYDDTGPDAETDAPSPEMQKRWQNGFEIFAPAMLHVAKGLTDLRAGDEPQMQCTYSYEAPNGGAICVYIPMACVHHFNAVADLLFKNGIPFPPSSHARIEALLKINFIVSDDCYFPKCLLPPSGALAA